MTRWAERMWLANMWTFGAACGATCKPAWKRLLPGIPSRPWAELLEGVRASPRWFDEVARGEDKILSGLGSDVATWRIPDLDEDVTDVRTLLRLAPALPG